MAGKILQLGCPFLPLVFCVWITSDTYHQSMMRWYWDIWEGQKGSVACWRWREQSESMPPPPRLREHYNSGGWKDSKSQRNEWSVWKAILWADLLLFKQISYVFLQGNMRRAHWWLTFPQRRRGEEGYGIITWGAATSCILWPLAYSSVLNICRLCS